MTYRGVWAQKTYHAGSVVTRPGSAWHTTVATCGVLAARRLWIGDWILMVKHGRDGKDTR